jgi:hypothetical protein
LRLSVVAQSVPYLLETGIQHRVTDELLGPQVPEQLVLGNDPLAVCEEIGKQLKHFRAEGNTPTGLVQIITFGVQGIVVKTVAHPRPPLSSAA